MDMWLSNARACFDRFHVARHLGDALNAMRKQAYNRLRVEGARTLASTMYLWLQSPPSMRPERGPPLSRLKDISTRTGCAWALKDAALRLVRLSQRWLGEEGLACVGDARLEEQARADGAGSARGQDPPRGDPERGGASVDERGCRFDERTDPADQADDLRISGPRAAPERDPLPPPGLDLYPRAASAHKNA
jgi:hypothetical protein